MRIKAGMLFIATGIAAAAALLVRPPAAGSSQLVDRNARQIRLEADQLGRALVSYTARGKRRYVLVTGAINALAPSQTGRQVKFVLTYSSKRPAFKNACSRYNGPALPFLARGCRAPDGSYWAVQAWQRGLPNYGLRPNAAQRARELRVSHWRGPIARLELKTDWAYGGRFDNIYGSLVYQGRPVHGFRSTHSGVPLDTFGRNIYLDTLDSAYGPGWRRENSFLTHRPTGTFCYALVAFRSGLTGKGKAYRATVIGPGVTPDVSKTVPAPGPFEPQRDLAANNEQALRGDRLCRGN